MAVIDIHEVEPVLGPGFPEDLVPPDLAQLGPTDDMQLAPQPAEAPVAETAPAEKLPLLPREAQYIDLGDGVAVRRSPDRTDSRRFFTRAGERSFSIRPGDIIAARGLAAYARRQESAARRARRQ